jgi:uncharacterized protein (TIGR00106 family)
MALMDISVAPLGTGSTSVSAYVAEAQRVLAASGLKYQLTPMATVVEGPLPELLALVERLHEAMVAAGALRLVTSIRLDDRRDKPGTMAGKLDSVKAHLQKEHQ